MDKIDRLGWADSISFTSYGTRIGIRANSSRALQSLLPHLPPGWKRAPQGQAARQVDRLYSVIMNSDEAPLGVEPQAGAGPRPGLEPQAGIEPRRGVRRFNVLYGDVSRLARSLEADDVRQAFESDLQLYVAEMARRRVFVHAGVVGWRGQAIILPGRTYTGKSTLVAALVRAGATYYSDEYAVLDARGRVHAYPRLLSLRGAPDEKPQRVSAEALGGRAGSRPLPVGLVVLSEYKSGAQWRPRRIAPGPATLELLANAIAARRRPEQALRLLCQVASQATVLKGARGEAQEMAQALLQRMEEF